MMPMKGVVEVFSIESEGSIHKVVYSEDGKIVVLYHNKSDAEKFMKFLEDNKIYTLGQWQKQPFKVRLAFCCSVTAYFPNLK